MLASAELIHETDETTDPCTDLDGLVGYFDGDSPKWLLVETKKAHSQDGAKQLREHLIPALSTATAEIVKKDFGRDIAWYLTVDSPALLTMPQDAS